MEKILITGHTGFLGKYIYEEQLRLNNHVKTLSRHVDANYSVDLSTEVPLLNSNFDKVIHISGKAHSIPKTPKEEKAFFDVNQLGTKNLLESLDGLTQKPNIFTLISTVAVYGLEDGQLISENVNANPTTPYGKSKCEAEKLVQKYCTEHNIVFFILRLPLVVGKSAPGNFGDMAKAIEQNKYIRVSDNFTKKSLVWAEDVANLIGKLNTSHKSGIYNLSDRYDPTFFELEESLALFYGKKIKISLPKFIIKNAAKLGDILNFMKIPFPLNSLRLSKLLSTLTFDSSKAVEKLTWNPTNVINNIDKILN